MAISFDLKAHDEQFHPDGFVEGKNKCKFRDRIKEFESVDDLSKAGDITDALENSEALENLLEGIEDEGAKKRIGAMLSSVNGILDGFLGKSAASVGSSASSKSNAPVQFGPNASIPHDKKAFPDKKDAKWQDALAHYGDSNYGWASAGSGSTRPHYISFNGKKYFVKKAGVNPSYTKEAARNEANANNFLRLAGLNAPDSMYLKADDGNRFCISTEADLSGGQLKRKLGTPKIDAQIKSAYPIMSLLYNMDLMQNAGNAFIDKNGNAVFLDNGSTFGFSAQGARNKYFDYDKRDNPTTGNPDFLALANFKGNNSGSNWRKAMNGGKQIDMPLALEETAKYEMGALAREAQKQGLLKQMPQQGQDNFIKFADELDKMSAKYKQAKPATAPASQTGVSSQSAPAVSNSSSVSAPTVSQQTEQPASGQQSAIDKLAKKYGLSTPTLKDNGDGTKSLTGFGSNVDFNKLRDFVKELNDNGLIPGFLASLSQNGTMTAAPAMSQKSVLSSLSSLGLGSTTSFNLASSVSAPRPSGAVSFGGGHFVTSSAASSFASAWNSANSNSGYTAKATQNHQTGQWEVTLYPTNKKQIAKTYGASANHSGTSSSSGASTGASSSSPSASNCAASKTTNHGSQQQVQQKANSTQQASVNPKHKAAVQRMQNLINNPNIPQSQKASYQAVLKKMNGGNNNTTPSASQPQAQTPSQTQQTTQGTGMNTSSAQSNPKYAAAVKRLQAMMNDPQLSAQQKAAIQSTINRFV